MKDIKEILNGLLSNTLGTSLEDALVVVPPMGESHITEQLRAIQNDYDLMKHFMLSGGSDSQRDVMYRRLRLRLFNVLTDAYLQNCCKETKTLDSQKSLLKDSDFQMGELRRKLEDFVSEWAIAGLDDNAESKMKSIYQRWHEYRKLYFAALLVGGHISDSNRDNIIELLLSPVVDSVDQEILVSGLLISLQRAYDDNKYLCLLRAFRECTNIKLRAHILVALTLALPDTPLLYNLFQDTINEIKLLFSEDDVKKELLELQMQMNLCNQVDDVNETLKNDIIPTIMKHQKPTDLLKDDTIEGSSLDEILKPNTSEESIDELEETVGRMDDMQKNGLDIYFGGFSKMKRDGFFYTLVNWFYPFTAYHPQLSQMPYDVLHGNLMKMLIEGASLCDSDMYSMALGVNHVYNMLPQQFKDMFGNNELKIRESFDRNTPAYYRRTYLQNLLRFYRLYPSKQDFHNPFYSTDDKEEEHQKDWFFMSSCIFTQSGLFTDELVSLAKYLFKKGKYDLCWVLIRKFVLHNTTDAQKKVLTLVNGLANYEKGYLADAIDDFQQVLETEPDNIIALKYCIIANLAELNYSDALEYAKRAMKLQPDNEQFFYHYLIALTGCGRVDEASGELFRLYFEKPDDIQVKRNMAWAYLFMKKPEKSSELFDKLIADGDREWTTLVNAVYAYAFTGNVEKVKTLYGNLMEVLREQEITEKSEVVDLLTRETLLVDMYNFSRTDFDVLLDCC